MLEQLPGNYQPLDFAGTLADRAQLYVAVELLRWIIFDEPQPLWTFETNSTWVRILNGSWAIPIFKRSWQRASRIV